MEAYPYASVSLTRRCAKCGQPLSRDTLGHGSLGRPTCHGKPTGRATVGVWLTAEVRGVITGPGPHPWKSRKATPAERKALAPLIAEVKSTGRGVHYRDVRELLTPTED